MNLRPMAPTDATDVARLLRELGYTGEADAVAARIRDLAAGAADLMLVAEAEGALVGWIHIQARLALTSAPFSEIEGLVVAASARRRGVARALVAAAEAWARARGHASLRVRSRVERTESHPLYESLAFHRTKTQHVYDKRLLPSAP